MSKIIKSGLLLTLSGALLFATGCASNRFKTATITELQVNERRRGKPPRVIQELAALQEFVAILSRASFARNSDREVERKLWQGWHIALQGRKGIRGGWLYDPENARVARMDIWSGVYVYTIQPQDRARFAALLH